MERIKKALFFLLPIIIGIYQTYLANRIWNFSKRINLVILVSSIGIIYYLFYLFYKKVDYKELEKNKKILLFSISIIITFFVIIAGFDFFVLRYNETSIRIEASDPNIHNAIPIKSIIKDNVVLEVNEEEKVSPVDLKFENCKDIIIVFEPKDNQGIINIYDGEIKKEIYLSKYTNSLYEYNVKSNTSMSLGSFIRLITSFIIIEIISFIFSMLSYFFYKDKKSLLLPTLAIIVIIQVIFYKQGIAYAIYGDTPEYETQYSLEDIMNFRMQGRVPIYPLIIKIFKLIFGDTLWRQFICLFQIIVSFISLIYLYKILRLLLNWEPLVLLIVFLYSINTAIIGWNNSILTESLALSLTVIFCYLIINYIKRTRLIYGILTILTMFFMVFLRPSFVGFVPLLCIFFLLRLFINKEKRSIELKSLLCSISLGIFVFVYSLCFYKQFGVFTLAQASIRQNLYICISEGFYKNSGNEQFIKDVDESLKEYPITWNAMLQVLEKYGNSDSSNLVKESRKNSLKEYLKYILKIIINNSDEYFGSYYIAYINDVPNIICKFLNSFRIINFTDIYILIIIESSITLYYLFKYHKVNWLHLGLFASMFLIVFTTFIGTNAEFMRTAICVLPFAYVSLGLVFKNILEIYKRKNV